jgi:hypothetical protein
MDCLRNFTFQTNWNQLISNPLNASTYQFWTSGVQQKLSCVTNYYSGPNTNISFLPQGFKNIDVYGIKINGYVISNPAVGGFGGIVTNWALTLNLLGQNPTLNGVISQDVAPTPTIAQNQNWTTFSLSERSPEIQFFSPIKSVSNVIPKQLIFQAEQCQTATDFNLFAQINVTIYYKFEGE